MAKDKSQVVRVAQVTLEKISAVTLRVASMRTSVRFYRDLLGMEVIYGGEDSYFSSLRPKNRTDPILNLEQGKPASQWGRLIFYVSDVDSFWAYLNERGLRPESPRDASWGERYFHMADPDGHEFVVCSSVKTFDAGVAEAPVVMGGFLEGGLNGILQGSD